MKNKPRRQRRRRAGGGAGTSMGSGDDKLLRLIMDPCGAELTTGYALSSTGLVQRFTRYITPAVTTENAFAFVWNPTSQGTAITQKTATGLGAPTNVSTPGPGEGFFESNADAAATLAACVEVLYTGTLVNRKGYIGVCQANWNVLAAIAAGTTDLGTLMSYCQAVSPVPSAAVELKWSPSMRNFVMTNTTDEGGASTDNALMVVAVGVSPNDFVVRFTAVYEYVPKFTLGAPAPRVTKAIPTGVGERIISRLDAAGHWWHNVGSTMDSLSRLGNQVVYGAGQAFRFARGVGRIASSATRALGPGTALLALVG